MFVWFQMVQLLKDELHECNLVVETNNRLLRVSETASDTGSSLLRTSADIQSDGSRPLASRPPLLHSASLPSHYGQDTSLLETSPSSSLATVLMERMSSLEMRVAEQQRRSEADMARLISQVCGWSILF